MSSTRSAGSGARRKKIATQKGFWRKKIEPLSEAFA
jgi:hypothetical protein